MREAFVEHELPEAGERREEGRVKGRVRVAGGVGREVGDEAEAELGDVRGGGGGEVVAGDAVGGGGAEVVGEEGAPRGAGADGVEDPVDRRLLRRVERRLRGGRRWREGGENGEDGEGETPLRHIEVESEERGVMN